MTTKSDDGRRLSVEQIEISERLSDLRKSDNWTPDAVGNDRRCRLHAL